MRLRVRVRGRVQGVWFRESTRRAAEAAGVRGWVRNCCDGSVEALLDGDDDAVKRVLDLVRVGPEHARVDQVEVAEEPVDEPAGKAPPRFEVR